MNLENKEEKHPRDNRYPFFHSAHKSPHRRQTPAAVRILFHNEKGLPHFPHTFTLVRSAVEPPSGQVYAAPDQPVNRIIAVGKYGNKKTFQRPFSEIKAFGMLLL